MRFFPFSLFVFLPDSRIMVKLETSLWYSSIFLKGLSFSPLSPKASSFQKVTNFAHFAFVIFSVSSIFLQILIYIIQNSTGSSFVTEHISSQVTFLQVLGKVTMYRVNRKEFFRLLSNMNNMIKNGSPELKRHLRECSSTGNVIYLFFMFATLLMVMDFCLVPLFRTGRDLPFPAWYPFHYKRSTILYSIAYTHQVSALALAWLCGAVDVMFGVLICGCCAQYRVMREILKGLNKSDSDKMLQNPGAEADNRSAIEFDKKIAELVDLHCEIFDSIKDINDIHTYILVVLFLTSVIMICCAGIQITNAYEKSINSQLMFIVMVCYVPFELLFYFVPGDMLVEEATAVGMAAYDSNWESMSPKCRYCVLSVILRSAKLPRLEIGRVAPLIFENYASFLTTAASYFTSLQAVAGVR